jgi:hypothetical protein
LQHENEGLRLEKIYSWNDNPSTLLSKLVRSGHGDRTAAEFLFYAVGNLDMNQARREVELFARNPENLSIWSREFFLDVATRIKIV